tara:strand:- start:10068 stop:10694 length:627 start_codon:yes stop_codon:yes gene_type:complete
MVDKINVDKRALDSLCLISGVFTLCAPDHREIKFLRLDVPADGNCGAHCLGILRISILGAPDDARGIRRAIGARARRHGMMHGLNLAEYCNGLVGSRFLETFELSLYCDMLKLNSAVVADTNDGSQTITLTGFQRAHKGWAIFKIDGLQDGVPHFQLLCHPRASPVRPVFSNQRARAILRKVGIEYPTTSFDPAFSLRYAGAISDFIG